MSSASSAASEAPASAAAQRPRRRSRCACTASGWIERGDGAGVTRRAEHARQDPRRGVPVLDPDRRLPGHPDDLDDRQRVGLHQVRLAGAQRGERPASTSPSAIWPGADHRRRQQLDRRLGARGQRPRALGGRDQRLEVAGHHVRDRRLEEHRRGAARVARAHAVGLAHEPLVRGDGRAAAHLDVAAQALGVGGEQRIVGQRGRLVEHAERALGRAAADRVAGRGQQPARARLGLRRELGGAAEVAHRGRVRAAAAGVERGLLERRRDGLVGRDRARREVPRALGALDRGGQRGVGAPALGQRRRVVDGRAHQRVAELELALGQRHDPRLLGRLEIDQRQAGVREPAADRVQPPGAGRRGDEQRAPRASPAAPRSRPRTRARRWCRAAAGPRAARARRAGRRTAARGSPAARAGCRPRWRPAGPRRRARSRSSSSARASLVRQRLDRHPVQPRHLDAAPLLARGADHHHALLPEPPPGEQERLQRRVVEPLRVVDHDQHRPLVGGAGEQRQQRGGNGEAVGRRRRTERQRAADRRRLHARAARRGGASSGVISSARPANGMSDSDLHPARPQQREVRRLLDRPPQQRGLADPGRPVQQQGAAAPFARGVEERLQAGSLVLAADHRGAESMRDTWSAREECASGSKPSSSSARGRCRAQPERPRHPGHRVGRIDLAQRHVAVALREPPAVLAEHQRHVGEASAPCTPSARASQIWRGVESTRSAPRTTSPMPCAASSTTTARL